MSQYQDKVANVLEILSYITASHDPNGIDVYFTTNKVKYQPRNSAEAVDIFRKHDYKYSDMKGRLGDIIEKYQKKLGEKHLLRGKIYDKKHPSTGPRKYSLYVLTDGVWQVQCDLEPMIKSLIGKLHENSSVNYQIGIQFIQFGSDPREQGRLSFLDSKLKEKYGL